MYRSAGDKSDSRFIIIWESECPTGPSSREKNYFGQLQWEEILIKHKYYYSVIRITNFLGGVNAWIHIMYKYSSQTTFYAVYMQFYSSLFEREKIFFFPITLSSIYWFNFRFCPDKIEQSCQYVIFYIQTWIYEPTKAV